MLLILIININIYSNNNNISCNDNNISSDSIVTTACYIRIFKYHNHL